MKLALVAAVSLAVLASPALAKGPSEVSIDGPGLAEPITIGLGEEGLAPGSPLMEFTEEVGFHEVVFGETTLAQRPEGALGPRYLVTYRVPGPYGDEFVLRQDLYPYAERGVVSYLAPRQSIYERKTVGGWFVASSDMKATLVALGLPADSPTVTDGSPFPWTIVVVLGALGAALFLAWALATRTRRAGPESKASA